MRALIVIDFVNVLFLATRKHFRNYIQFLYKQSLAFDVPATADFERAAYTFLRSQYKIGHFEGYFEGARTFLAPKIS